MSNYTSENTEILAMHTDESRLHPNTRMLLLHRCENGRLQYVIGSYFASVWNGTCYEYSWDWGHYFDEHNGNGALFRAVHYWEREVLGIEERSGDGIEG
ncbi:MAG: hypothetical protein IJ087_01345 [Eggerthellaceae bacterium]|nr:hypothetical protein [Eggerthellaceae bacterium]